MHATIHQKFRSLVAAFQPAGRVLEIGATPEPVTLLAMPELHHLDRVGINLAPPGRFDGFDVIQGNANHMAVFDDDTFDLVLSNAVLEHDERFWLTCAEIRRITRPGGMAIIGVPGFTPACDLTTLGLVGAGASNGLEHCSLTFKYHGFPHDYYRFSERAVQNIFFEGFEDVGIHSLMVPPRIIGVGRKALH